MTEPQDITVNTTSAAFLKAKALFDEHVGKKLPAFQTLRPSGKTDEKITDLGQAEVWSEVVLLPINVAG